MYVLIKDKKQDITRQIRHDGTRLTRPDKSGWWDKLHTVFSCRFVTTERKEKN